MAFDLADVLDSRAVSAPPRRRLLAEFRAVLSRRPPPPRPEDLPPGQGRPVLVVPPLCGNDAMMRGLRRFLARCGFLPFPWGLGIDWGPTPRLLAGLEARLDALHRGHGPLALVGVSMGGLLARNLAHDRPDQVSRVATLGSPFRLPTASTIAPLIRLSARRYSRDIQPARLSASLPMPALAIWTAADGVVAPESCRSPGTDATEVGGAHMTLPSNPAALCALVRFLAPPLGPPTP